MKSNSRLKLKILMSMINNRRREVSRPLAKLRGIRQLRRFMSDKEIQADGLDNIEDPILAKSGEICRQTEITDFFKVV